MVEGEKELNFSLLRVIIDVFCVKNTHVGAYTCVCEKKVVSLRRELKYVIMLGFSSTQEKELRLRHKSTVRKALAQREAGVVTDEDLALASFEKEPANVVLCK